MSGNKTIEFKKIISNGTLTEISLELEESNTLLNERFGKEQNSALHIVIMKRDSDCMQVVKNLVEAGIYYDAKDIYGNTALLLAAKLYKMDVAGYLVTICDVTVQNNFGLNIIHMLASRSGLSGVFGTFKTGLKCKQNNKIKDLINQQTFSDMPYKRPFCTIKGYTGKNITVRGWYPIHFAALICDLESVTWLINHGAGINEENSDRVTARELLVKYKNNLAHIKHVEPSKLIIGKLRVGRAITQVSSRPKTPKKVRPSTRKKRRSTIKKPSLENNYFDDKGVQFNGFADTGVQTSPITFRSNDSCPEQVLIYSRCSTPYDKVITPADNVEVNDHPPIGPISTSSFGDQVESRNIPYPTDKLIADIAKEIEPKDYRFFGIHLGIEYYVIEAVYASRSDPSERTLQLLISWRNDCRLIDKGKKEHLINALRKIDKNDIVAKFFKDRGHTPKYESKLINPDLDENNI